MMSLRYGQQDTVHCKLLLALYLTVTEMDSEIRIMTLIGNFIHNFAIYSFIWINFLWYSLLYYPLSLYRKLLLIKLFSYFLSWTGLRGNSSAIPTHFYKIVTRCNTTVKTSDNVKGCIGKLESLAFVFPHNQEPVCMVWTVFHTYHFIFMLLCIIRS